MKAETSWIDIKDKLPEMGQHVLSYEHRANMPIKVNYINNYENKFSYGKTEHITHWMPLPEPPEDTI